MNLLLLLPPQTPEGGAGQTPMWLSLLPFVLIFVIFYFLLIRPHSKRQKELAKMLSDLKQGDRVITSGGIYGTVFGVKDDIAVLKVADQVKIEVAKSAITGVVQKGKEA